MISNSAADTRKLGEKLGLKIRMDKKLTTLSSRDLGSASTGNEVRTRIVALYGELGSGKTTLVKGIAKGLGCKDMVKSPSFVFVHEYRGKVPLYHIDLYRINNLKDLEVLGIDEFFSLGGVCIIEWAEKAKGLLPKECINIKLKILNKNKRKITIYEGLGH